MIIKPTELKNLYVLERESFSDYRGSFNRMHHTNNLMENDLCSDIAESLYSVSKNNVLRGMHYQKSPFDQVKIVTCLKGAILDVVVNKNKESEDFGKTFSIALIEGENKSLYIGNDFAHGFYSYEDDTIVSYTISKYHMPEYDCGILWNSIDFDWSIYGIDNPIISERDNLHKKINEI